MIAEEIIAAGEVLVLTGAGISTDSGIPDYRSPASRRRKRNPTKHREFLHQPEARRRYWARSTVGVLTQNVDGLHQAAGSRRVLELHGSLHDVCCLDCGEYETREAVHRRLLQMNPGWPGLEGEMAPDGDVDLPSGAEETFSVAACSRCGGVLKPEVVFFGDSVPRERVERAWEMVAAAASILVAGSSLSVFSGYRFVREAARQGKPIVIINDGETRGDPHAAVKLEGRIAELLPQLVTAQKTARVEFTLS